MIKPLWQKVKEHRPNAKMKKVLTDNDVQGWTKGSTKTWDQFAVNEELFGVKSSYDNKMLAYTTDLSNSKLTPEQITDKEKLAKEWWGQHEGVMDGYKKTWSFSLRHKGHEHSEAQYLRDPHPMYAFHRSADGSGKQKVCLRL